MDFRLFSQTNIDSQLSKLFTVLGSTAPDVIKEATSDSITQILQSFLKDPESFKQKPEVKYLGKVASEDNKLNIYSWNYQHVNHAYKYACILQYKTESDGIKVIVLEDNTKDIPENKTLKPGEWYGCLYYKIIVKTKRKKTYYTLLGWDGNNDMVARKVIDVLIFKSDNEPVLGAAVFKMEKGTQKRVVFKFAATGSMMLVYDPDYKRIIFDHLSPASPELKGQYRYYGSDFTYDGFKFKRGKWVFEEMLDPRNKDE